MFATEAIAQQEPDSSFVYNSMETVGQASNGANAVSSDGTSVRDIARTIHFSPKDVQFQSRYRPTENDSLFPSQFWKRMYFGVGAGMVAISDNIGSVANANFTAFAGYRFTPIHSLRLHANMAIINYNQGRNSTPYYGMGIDYLANLSNFALGYNPSRIVDISTVLGGGVRMGKIGLPARMNPYAYAGLRGDLYFSSNFSLFVEPYVGLQRRMESVFGRASAERWNLIYGVSAGLQLDMNKHTDHFADADSLFRSCFFDSSIGLVVPGRGGDMIHRSGVGYQVAAGMWLNPMIGLRLGAQAQTFYNRSTQINMYGVPTRTSNAQALLSARAEFLLSPMNFIKRWRNARGGHDFDLNVSLGGDFGINAVFDDSNIMGGAYRGRYYGLTGALQAMYRIAAPGTYIYMEPRYLATMYDVPYSSANSGGSITDHLFSFNVGTRLYMTGSYNTDSKNKEFTRHWWMGADIGGVKWQRTVHRTTGGLGINPAVNLSVGYDWTRYVTLRSQWAYQRLFYTHDGGYYGYDSNGKRRSGRGLWNSAYDIMDFRLAYMLNLNNLFQEYNNRRGFNLWLTAGPAISYVLNGSDLWVNGQENEQPSLDLLKLTDEREGKISPAIYASVMAAFRVAPQYEITVEAMGQYNVFSGVNPGNRPIFNNAKYGLSVGTRYHFVPGMMSSYGGLRGRRFFFDSSLSWASGSLSDFFHMGGTKYDLSLGMWFTPVLGARIGANAQTIRYSSTDVVMNGQNMRSSESMLAVGARAELMLNPFNLFQRWRSKEGGHDFEANVLVGVEAGGISKLPKRSVDLYYGLTGGLQFLYRVNNPGTYIFLEPRILAARYNDAYMNTGVVSNKIHDMYSLGVGTRIYMTKASSPREGRDKMIPHWWTAFSLGGVKVQHSTALHHPDAIGWNPSVAMSIGYDFKPLASFRAQLSYQRLKEYTFSSYSGMNAQGVRVKGEGLWERAYNAIELHADYMFNVNNLLQGYDANRKFNMWLAAGPAITILAGDSRSWVDGQTDAPLSLKALQVGGGSAVSKISPAVSASMISTLRVASNVDLMAEAQGQFNVFRGANPFLQGNPGAYMMPNKIKYGVFVGARYHFSHDALRNLFAGAASQPWQKGWFLDASYGWAMPFGTGLGMRASGSNMSASLGYWFNRMFGLRLGVAGIQTYHGGRNVKAVIEPVSGMQVHAPYSVYNSQLTVGGRVELMFNPVNILFSRAEHDEPTRWDMAVSAGVNVGGMHKVGRFTSRYTGFTVSAALLYRISREAQLYVEPRYDVFKHGRVGDGADYNASTSDRMFTVSVGTRVSRPVEATRESRRPANREERAHRGLWIEGNVGGSKMVQLQRVAGEGSAFNPMIGVSVGYDLTRLSSFRASMSYNSQSRMSPNQPYMVTSSGVNRRYRGTVNSMYHLLDMQLMYMFNASNFWTGCDKRNSFNVYLEGGPMISKILAQSNALADGEVMGGTDFRYLGNDHAGKSSYGMVAGVLMTLPLSSHWDIATEVTGQFYLTRGYIPDYATGFFSGTKINFSLGTRYNF